MIRFFRLTVITAGRSDVFALSTIYRIIGFLFVALYVSTIILPVTAATTQLHIIKYASDGTTILSEKTLTFQEMESSLPVQGDGLSSLLSPRTGLYR